MTVNRSTKRVDLLVMVAMPILIFVAVLVLRLNFLIATLLFLGLPSVYLSFRYRTAITKTLLFSTIFGLPMTFIIDTLGLRDHAWYVPVSVLPVRFTGIPIEDFIWGFLTVYLIVIFYEYFLDRPDRRGTPTYRRYLIATMLCAVSIMAALIASNSPILTIPYSYFWMGVVMLLVPVGLYLWQMPGFLARYAILTIYFFFTWLLLELAGVSLQHWVWVGRHFIGWVTLFGQTFPFEEFFFYICLAAIWIVSCYEFFFDDRR